MSVHNRSTITAIFVATAVAVWHAWCLIPIPSEEARAALEAVTARGATLAPEQLAALQQNLYEMAVRNRIWDGLLMLAAALTAIGLSRRNIALASIALAAYGAIGLAYAYTEMDVAKWGVGELVSVQVSRLQFLAKTGDLGRLADHLFRLGTILLACVSLPVGLFFLYQRYLGARGDSSGTST